MKEYIIGDRFYPETRQIAAQIELWNKRWNGNGQRERLSNSFFQTHQESDPLHHEWETEKLKSPDRRGLVTISPLFKRQQGQRNTPLHA